MDDDAKKHLDSMSDRIGFMENRIVTLVEHLADSLKSEMAQRFDKVDTRFDQFEARMDRMEARMDRIGGRVNVGSRASARLAEWTEKSDQFAGETLRRLNDLDQRMAKIESKNRNN